jgi:hypothetical protein
MPALVPAAFGCSPAAWAFALCRASTQLPPESMLHQNVLPPMATGASNCDSPSASSLASTSTGFTSAADCAIADAGRMRNIIRTSRAGRRAMLDTVALPKDILLHSLEQCLV